MASTLADSYAEYRIGRMYAAGLGIGQDCEAAALWFGRSAAQNYASAQYALARWFEKAAEQGNEYAQYFLDHMNDLQGPPLLTNATRLLHHMSRIFRDEAPPSLPVISFVDSKLRRRIREKKIAMGHKPDDHEDQGIAMR